jgi:hypothetical protein
MDERKHRPSRAESDASCRVPAERDRVAPPMSAWICPFGERFSGCDLPQVDAAGAERGEELAVGADADA